jgi:hypothetical protein
MVLSMRELSLPDATRFSVVLAYADSGKLKRDSEDRSGQVAGAGGRKMELSKVWHKTPLVFLLYLPQMWGESTGPGTEINQTKIRRKKHGNFGRGD